MRGLLVVLLIWSLGAEARGAEVVPWLYEVSVPVENQTARARSQAAGDALLQLLSRLTGLAHVPMTEEVQAAAANPDRFYNEFRFDEAPDEEEGLVIVVQFDPNPVIDLVRTAGLPIWSASRERVLVWLVLEDGGRRTLVGSTSDSPLVPGFDRRAKDRGVPLTLPLLDLEDQLAVDPAAVWGRLSDVIDPASERYAAEVLLLGRVSYVGGDLAWRGDWEFWVDGAVVPFATEGGDLTGHAVQAVDVLADELADRRIVHGRQAGRIDVAVAGVATPEDYGALLRYVRSLEFIERVGVTGMRENRLWLALDTPAEPEQLLAAFERDGRLQRDLIALIDAADLRVIWRDSD